MERLYVLSVDANSTTFSRWYSRTMALLGFAKGVNRNNIQDVFDAPDIHEFWTFMKAR